MKAIRTIIVLGALLLGPLAHASELTVDNLTVTTNVDIYGEMNFYMLGGVTTGAVTATGGTITESGGYRYHTFTANGTFEVIGGSLICDVLVVGGGGGGGNGFAGGGGGAGGVLLRNSFVAAIGTYPIVVGVGGGSSTTYSEKGTNGTDSSFANILAYGGGGGGAGGSGDGGGPSYINGKNGGSGGGGGGETWKIGYGGLGTDGQGYAGGNSFNGTAYFHGGGGGGASEAGQNGTVFAPGNGGAGTNVWGNDYGGGGGSGGTHDGCGSPGVGGIGGGGDGGTDNLGIPGSNGKDGLDNKGGGGGGGACSSGCNVAGNERNVTEGGSGGSGIVIVRYLIGQAASSNIPTLTISSNGISQVSTSAVNVFMGKVGIGTESPAEKLHVSENVRIDGSLTMGGETRSNWPTMAEGALMASSNLSDVADVAAARANLGLGSAATNEATVFLMPTSDGSQLTGITAEQVGAVSTNAGALLAGNNLSDVANAGTSRSNLGLGTAATNDAGAFLSINGGTMNGAIIFPAAFGDIPMGVYTNR